VLTYPAKTASLLEPYREPVGNDTSEWATPSNATTLSPYWNAPILALTFEKLILNKIDAQLHADGDRSVRSILDAVETFRGKYPNWTDYRIGIAHDELTHPDDWPRFAKLGVDAIMSYQWAQPAPAWMPLTFDALGPERVQYLEASAHIAEKGRPIIYGSDWPVRRFL
jgi:predicted amidohydrolase YtcJ